MEAKRSDWIECLDDDTVIVHKTQPGSSEWGMIFMVALWCLYPGGVLLCAPLISGYPMSRTQISLTMGGGLGAIAIGLAVMVIIYARSVRGVWFIDNEGIEFQPKRGPRCRIGWKNVESVKWPYSPLVFLGEGKRITLRRGLHDECDWKRVPERIEKMLAGRFDLTVKPAPSQELNIIRVTGLAAPSALLTSLLMLGLPSFRPALAAFTVLAVLIFMVATAFWCAIGLYRESKQRNPTWRVAKPRPGDREDWYF